MNLKEFLDIKSEEYNNTSFIENDPIQIPHKFKTKEDIEISGFLTATIAWGNRKSIINSSKKMMELLENDPHNFIINHSCFIIIFIISTNHYYIFFIIII